MVVQKRETSNSFHDLTYLVKSYYTAQRERIRATNRVSSTERLDQPISADVQFVTQKWVQIEKEFEHRMKKSVERAPSWQWLKNQRGIGHILGAELLGEFGNRRWPRVSSLWKYCGLHVVNGKAPRLRHGELAGFDPWASPTSTIAGHSQKVFVPWRRNASNKSCKIESCS
jgi:hypothetical protein